MYTEKGEKDCMIKRISQILEYREISSNLHVSVDATPFREIFSAKRCRIAFRESFLPQTFLVIR